MTKIYSEDEKSFAEFTCPECQHHRIEEIMEDVVVSSVIESIGEGGDIDYGNQSNDDGEVVRYQCMNCGYALPCENDSEALYNYLIARKNEDE